MPDCLTPRLSPSIAVSLRATFWAERAKWVAGWWSFNSEDIDVIIRPLTKCWESRGCKRKCTSFLGRKLLPGHCNDRKFPADIDTFFPGGYCYFASNFHRIEYRMVLIVIPAYPCIRNIYAFVRDIDSDAIQISSIHEWYYAPSVSIMCRCFRSLSSSENTRKFGK